ncbi:hypothetical protein QVD17_35643 [Tagetes erecta]|uniref:Uncharacterized protein n=1 Tax=Tagetes erecta TaxID=13708 RepID=A0AAD8JSJ4_TARER|nr:hypothetical protein QVD17_35643 [Tagetes erecta]
MVITPPPKATSTPSLPPPLPSSSTVSLPPDLSSDFMDLAFGIPEVYNPIVHNTLVSISKQSTIKAWSFWALTASYSCFPVMFDRETNVYKNFIDTATNMAKSSGLIANTFAGFEERAVEALQGGKCSTYSPTPPVYLVGPLIDSKVDCSENECLKWLNSQPSRSVVFLCFGSMGVFKKHQLKEIAIGLMKSEQRFLWVVRDLPPDNENDPGSDGKDVGLDEILPEEFLGKTADKGLVVKNWAPQPAILGHDSVGGFKMNRVVLVEELKVAVAVTMSEDGFVGAESVEEKVRALIEGEEGRSSGERSGFRDESKGKGCSGG